MREDAVILVVDDQPDLLENISLALETAGYQILKAADGLQAIEALNSHPVDLILSDVAMPNMNGYHLLDRVRSHPTWTRIPFLFLTARNLDSDIRYGKELGVEDYLTKPIGPEDLVATVRGKLRRARQLEQVNGLNAAAPADSLPSSDERAQPSARLTLGRLQIDPGQYRVWLDGDIRPLSAREFTLLEYLARRPRQVVPAQELIQVTHQAQPDGARAGSRLRPIIRTIRRKLGYAPGDMGCIENVRGVGYRLIPPD